jgi:AraC-like DNA-binding protein
MEGPLLEACLCGAEAAGRTLAPQRGIRTGCWRCDAISITVARPLPRTETAGSQLSIVMPGAGAELDVTLPAQRRMLHLTEADALILTSRVQHTIHCARGTSAVLIELGSAVCAPLSDAHQGPRTFVGPDAFLTATAQMLQARLEAGWNPGRDYLTSLARLIVVHVRHMQDVRAQERSPVAGLPRHKLRIIKSMIDERICGNLEVRELSAAVGMSPAHFSRVFKRATGYSPYVYVTLRRVRRAHELMLMSDASATDAAAAVGLRTARRLATMAERFIVAPVSTRTTALCPQPAAMVKAG